VLEETSAINARVDELKNTLLATSFFLKESLAADARRIENIVGEKHKRKASQGTGSFAHSPRDSYFMCVPT
jgi:hypothetical protein